MVYVSLFLCFFASLFLLVVVLVAVLVVVVVVVGEAPPRPVGSDPRDR